MGMRDVPAIIEDLGGPTAFGRAIGVEPSTASEMKRRKSIPVRYWPSVLGAAREQGKELTSDDLMAAHTPAESAA
jgi:hypothetical protein